LVSGEGLAPVWPIRFQTCFVGGWQILLMKNKVY
jgi:hypothetical protein